MRRKLVAEAFGTFTLPFAGTSASPPGAKEKGIAAGAVIGVEAMFAGPVCGASMNPARSLAPAVLSGRTEHLWVYLIAPPLGASAAVAVGRLLSDPEEANPRSEAGTRRREKSSGRCPCASGTATGAGWRRPSPGYTG